MSTRPPVLNPVLAKNPRPPPQEKETLGSSSTFRPPNTAYLDNNVAAKHAFFRLYPDRDAVANTASLGALPPGTVPETVWARGLLPWVPTSMRHVMHTYDGYVAASFYQVFAERNGRFAQFREKFEYKIGYVSPESLAWARSNAKLSGIPDNTAYASIPRYWVEEKRRFLYKSEFAFLPTPVELMCVLRDYMRLVPAAQIKSEATVLQRELVVYLLLCVFANNADGDAAEQLRQCCTRLAVAVHLLPGYDPVSKRYHLDIFLEFVVDYALALFVGRISVSEWKLYRTYDAAARATNSSVFTRLAKHLAQHGGLGDVRADVVVKAAVDFSNSTAAVAGDTAELGLRTAIHGGGTSVPLYTDDPLPKAESYNKAINGAAWEMSKSTGTGTPAPRTNVGLLELDRAHVYWWKRVEVGVRFGVFGTDTFCDFIESVLKENPENAKFVLEYRKKYNVMSFAEYTAFVRAKLNARVKKDSVTDELMRDLAKTARNNSVFCTFPIIYTRIRRLLAHVKDVYERLAKRLVNREKVTYSLVFDIFDDAIDKCAKENVPWDFFRELDNVLIENNIIENVEPAFGKTLSVKNTLKGTIDIKHSSSDRKRTVGAPTEQNILIKNTLGSHIVVQYVRDGYVVVRNLLTTKPADHVTIMLGDVSKLRSDDHASGGTMPYLMQNTLNSSIEIANATFTMKEASSSAPEYLAYASDFLQAVFKNEVVWCITQLLYEHRDALRGVLAGTGVPGGLGGAKGAAIVNVRFAYELNEILRELSECVDDVRSAGTSSASSVAVGAVPHPNWHVACGKAIGCLTFYETYQFLAVVKDAVSAAGLAPSTALHTSPDKSTATVTTAFDLRKNADDALFLVLKNSIMSDDKKRDALGTYRAIEALLLGIVGAQNNTTNDIVRLRALLEPIVKSYRGSVNNDVDELVKIVASNTGGVSVDRKSIAKEKLLSIVKFAPLKYDFGENSVAYLSLVRIGLVDEWNRFVHEVYRTEFYFAVYADNVPVPIPARGSFGSGWLAGLFVPPKVPFAHDGLYNPIVQFITRQLAAGAAKLYDLAHVDGGSSAEAYAPADASVASPASPGTKPAVAPAAEPVRNPAAALHLGGSSSAAEHHRDTDDESSGAYASSTSKAPGTHAEDRLLEELVSAASHPPLAIRKPAVATNPTTQKFLARLTKDLVYTVDLDDSDSDDLSRYRAVKRVADPVSGPAGAKRPAGAPEIIDLA